MSRRDNDMNNFDDSTKKHLHNSKWSTRPAYLQEYLSNEQHHEQVRERLMAEQSNSKIDDINLRLAEKYRYDIFPRMERTGDRYHANMLSGFTEKQHDEWKTMHRHCGRMNASRRAKIMREMQEDTNVTPQEFHLHIMTCEEVWYQHVWKYFDDIAALQQIHEDKVNRLADLENIKRLSDLSRRKNKERIAAQNEKWLKP